MTPCIDQHIHLPDRLAAFDVVAPGLRRVTIAAPRASTTLAEISRAAGLPDPSVRSGDLPMLLVDGTAVATAQGALAAGLCHGSTIGPVNTLVDSDGVPDDSCLADTPVVEAVWLTGIDAGATTLLIAGRHLVGRSCSASVRCEDPALELHHALLEVRADGSTTIVQLSGLQPMLLDNSAVADAVALDHGVRVRLGGSSLSLQPVQIVPDAPRRAVGTHRFGPVRSTDPWRVPVVRGPRAIRSMTAAEIVAPRRRTSVSMFGGGLVPTMIGLLGAGVMAVVFDQLMFLMFGALGAFIAFGTWFAQKIGLVRSRRGVGREYDSAVAAFSVALESQRNDAAAMHRASVSTLHHAMRRMRDRDPALWEVRATDPDAFRVSIGEGQVVWTPQITGLTRDTEPQVLGAIDRASRLEDLPVAAWLGPATVTSVIGDDAAAVARSMILQLAAASGPADWQLAVLSGEPNLWSGLGWIPQAVEVDGSMRLAAPEGCSELLARMEGDDRHLVIVIDHPELLGARTSPLRRLMAAGDRSMAIIVVCAAEGAVPAVSTSALYVGRRGVGRWIADTRTTALAEPVRIAGASRAATFVAAAALARLTDPELLGEDGGLPREVGILDLMAPKIGRDHSAFPHQIAALWAAAGSDPAPSTPIGIAADGTIEIDLLSDGPHGLIAGTTGAGKSELLRSLVVGLATRHSPNHITFVLVDYKGGSTFDACARLPHVVGVVTDLDERLAARALRSLEAELRRRELILRSAAAPDLAAYRAGQFEAALPRLVVVIDEFATLATQQPEFIGALLGIAQRGRSLGVHLLLATQRPGGVVNDDIRANTNLRIALRVQSRTDSVDVIGDPAAASLARSIPGRAVMRLGVDDLITFQTACSRGVVRSGQAERTELVALVESVLAAAEMTRVPAPHRPWLPALGEDSSGSWSGLIGSDAEVADPARIGWIDDPDNQCRLPLRWCPADGHLLLIGAPGTGTTSALIAIAAAVVRANHEIGLTAPELFVLDAMGDVRLERLAQVPGCVAVVRLHETERLLRLLAALTGEIAHRKSCITQEPPHAEIVVLIDGLGALRTELESLDRYDQLIELDLIVTEGQALGVLVVAAAARPSAVSSALLGHIGHRWMFHLADRMDASILGVPPAMVPEPVPGRLIDARTRREAQLDAVDDRFVAEQLAQPRASAGAGGNSESRLGPGLASADDGRCVRPARRLEVLPALVRSADLPDGVACDGDSILTVGVAFDSLLPCQLAVAAGEHLLVLGASRSGRTTALHTIADSWRQAHPDGWIASVVARRTGARVGEVFPDVISLLAALGGVVDGPRLIVIDDAELVDDPTGALTSMIASRCDELTVAAAGRPDALRTSYGHWTLAVRRSRLGLAMASCSDLDGDLLNASLPRRLPIRARPGLAWLVADGQRQLVQVACT